MIVRGLYCGTSVVDKIYKNGVIIWKGEKEEISLDYIINCIISTNEFASCILADLTQITIEGVCPVCSNESGNIEPFDSVQQNLRVTVVFIEDDCKRMIPLPSVLFESMQKSVAQSLFFYGTLAAAADLLLHFKGYLIDKPEAQSAIAALAKLGEHFKGYLIDEAEAQSALAAPGIIVEHYRGYLIDAPEAQSALAALGILAEHFKGYLIDAPEAQGALAALGIMTEHFRGYLIDEAEAQSALSAFGILTEHFRGHLIDRPELQNALSAFGILTEHFKGYLIDAPEAQSALSALGILTEHFSGYLIDGPENQNALSANGKLTEHFSGYLINRPQIQNALSAFGILTQHLNNSQIDAAVIRTALSAFGILAEHFNDCKIKASDYIAGLVADATHRGVNARHVGVHSNPTGEIQRSKPVMLPASAAEGISTSSQTDLFNANVTNASLDETDSFFTTSAAYISLYLPPVKSGTNLYIRQVYNAISNNKNLIII